MRKYERLHYTNKKTNYHTWYITLLSDFRYTPQWFTKAHWRLAVTQSNQVMLKLLSVQQGLIFFNKVYVYYKVMISPNAAPTHEHFIVKLVFSLCFTFGVFTAGKESTIRERLVRDRARTDDHCLCKTVWRFKLAISKHLSGSESRSIQNRTEPHLVCFESCTRNMVYI